MQVNPPAANTKSWRFNSLYHVRVNNSDRSVKENASRNSSSGQDVITDEASKVLGKRTTNDSATIDGPNSIDASTNPGTTLVPFVNTEKDKVHVFPWYPKK